MRTGCVNDMRPYFEINLARVGNYSWRCYGGGHKHIRKNKTTFKIPTTLVICIRNGAIMAGTGNGSMQQN